MLSSSTFVKIWCGVIAVSALIIIGCDVGANNKYKVYVPELDMEVNPKAFYGVYSGTISLIAAIVAFVFVKKKDTGL